MVLFRKVLGRSAKKWEALIGRTWFNIILHTLGTNCTKKWNWVAQWPTRFPTADGNCEAIYRPVIGKQSVIRLQCKSFSLNLSSTFTSLFWVFHLVMNHWFLIGGSIKNCCLCDHFLLTVISLFLSWQIRVKPRFDVQMHFFFNCKVNLSKQLNSN